LRSIFEARLKTTSAVRGHHDDLGLVAPCGLDDHFGWTSKEGGADLDLDVDARRTQPVGDPLQFRPRFWLLDEGLSAAWLRSEHAQQQQPGVAGAGEPRGVGKRAQPA
jgi:hypothetical protein